MVTKKLINVECLVCKKNIERVPSQVKEKNYCSQYCYKLFCKEENEKKKKEKFSRHKCRSCGTNFLPFYEGQKFCSHKCSSKGLLGSNRSKSESFCQTCQKSFLVFNYRLKEKGKFFCSRDCYWKSDKSYNRAKWTEYNGKKFRSSYEARYAKLLDSLRIEWIYEPKRFDLGWCTYMPDFYLPKTDEYKEVKGWMTEEAQRKVDSFISLGYNLEVIYKEDMDKLDMGVGGYYGY